MPLPAVMCTRTLLRLHAPLREHTHTHSHALTARTHSYKHVRTHASQVRLGVYDREVAELRDEVGALSTRLAATDEAAARDFATKVCGAPCAARGALCPVRCALCSLDVLLHAEPAGLRMQATCLAHDLLPAVLPASSEHLTG